MAGEAESVSAPEQLPPRVSRPAPAGRKFPCPQCGARLDFDPGSRGLKCPYCGHNEVIEPSTRGVDERDWDGYWSRQVADETPLPGRSSQVTCQGCGAVVLLQDQVATDRCPYCATHLENEPEVAQAMVPPGGLLPFAVTQRQAIDAFDAWIAGRWFAPRGLKQFANLGKLAGVYVPFWTYDSMTYTYYTGERGDDYQETESYWATETDASGNTRQVRKTRTVTKTRWTSVSGEVQHFFDDVLIYASHSLPLDLVESLPPWDLEQLDEFKADFLSGFQTERYTIGLSEGFVKAQAIMDEHIRELCRQDIGGDHQRLHGVSTQHVGVSFKHLLLPTWLAAYRYHERPFRILVNGRTGKVVGTRPYSAWKIVLFVLMILALIAALFLGFGLLQGGLRGGSASPTTQATSLAFACGLAPVWHGAGEAA
jgi:DNA-directed RNA polymerase subunit RPC12/RpoP